VVSRLVEKAKEAAYLGGTILEAIKFINFFQAGF
jgi:hypothetical protein